MEQAQERCEQRDRRRQRHHRRSGPRTVPRQRPLHARLPQQSRRAWARPGAGWRRPRRSRSANSRTSKFASGPAMIRDENGLLTGYVYVDLADRDPGSYVDRGQPRAARASVKLPPGTPSPGAASTKPCARVKPAPERRRAGHSAPCDPAPLPEHAVAGQDASSFSWRFPSRPSARSGLFTCSIQHECRGMGGPDRAAEYRCRNRCLHAPLPRSCV